MSEAGEIPHLPSTEAAVLGAILSEGIGWWRKLEILEGSNNVPSLFHVSQNKIVARAIEQSVELGDEITDASVEDALNSIAGDNLSVDASVIIIQLQAKAAISSLEELQKSVASLVQSRAQRRMLRDVEKIRSKILDDSIPPMEISREMQKAATGNLVAKDVQTIAEFMDIIESEDQLNSTFQIPTGLTELDKHLGGGIEGGRNYVIAARPKVGKTTLLMNIVGNMLYLENDPVIVFVSLETLHRDFMYKMLSAMSQVDQNITKSIYYNQVSAREAFEDEDDYEEFMEARKTLRESDLYPIFPQDIPSGMQSLMSIVMTIISKHPGRDIILTIDYLQLLVNETRFMREQVTEFTRTLKLLAMEHGIAVVYLSQLNRAGAHGEMPSPSDMRESGSIEQDVDTAIMLNRRHLYDQSEPSHVMDIDVALNRAGTSGLFKVNWDGATNTIVDMINEWGN